MKDYDHYIRQVFRSSQENYFSVHRKYFPSPDESLLLLLPLFFRVICYAWFLELSIWCLKSVECDGWKECAHFRILHTFQQSEEHFIYIKIVECHLSMNFRASFFFFPFYLCVVVAWFLPSLYMLHICEKKEQEQVIKNEIRSGMNKEATYKKENATTTEIWWSGRRKKFVIFFIDLH